MPVTHTANDLLPHIQIPHAVPDSAPASDSLEAKSSSNKGTITILSFAVASLVIYYKFKNSKLDVSLNLDTPFTSTELGHSTLDSKHPSIKLGGSASGFKAEVEFDLDTHKMVLTMKATGCAPGVGCTSGSTSLHV
jgi:hypothetical protein